MIRTTAKLLAMVMLITMLAACGAGAPAAKTEPAAPVSGDPAHDPMNPPVELSTAFRTVANTVFANGHDWENTVWTPIYKNLGITVKFLWTEDGNYYDERLNLAISTNEIPDFFRAYDPQVNMMLKGGMLCDMTDAYNTYASEYTRFAMEADGGVYMAGGYINGKLMALPREAEIKKDQSELLWIRKDWLENVGLERPNTLEEFLAVCDAFTNGDPDKNGKADTYAMGAVGINNLIKDWGGFRGLFIMYDVQPGVFFSDVPYFEKNAEGEIIWSASKPGMADALRNLQYMYSKGYLAKDFPTMDVDVAMIEDVTSGKCGMFFGPDWCAGWPLDSCRENNPKADWIAIPTPTATGKPTRLEFYRPNSSWTLVSSKCAHPEAVIKMLNAMCDIYYSPDRFKLRKDIEAAPGVTDAGMGSVYAPMLYRAGVFAVDDYFRMVEAVKKNDPSGLQASEMNTWQNIQDFKTNPGSGVAWAENFYSIHEPGHAYYSIYEELTDDRVQRNEYMGLMTENMAKYMPQYRKNAEELIINIILGKKQPEDWMSFINDVWPGMGGDEILKEVRTLAAGNKN